MKNISSEFGDYSRQVTLKLEDGVEIQCDYELASEIAFLNMKGIKTVSSCSGHGISDGVIAVEKEYVNDMKKLGYIEYSKYNNSFYSKKRTCYVLLYRIWNDKKSKDEEYIQVFDSIEKAEKHIKNLGNSYLDGFINKVIIH